jgi:hypothetical protein
VWWAPCFLHIFPQVSSEEEEMNRSYASRIQKMEIYHGAPTQHFSREALAKNKNILTIIRFETTLSFFCENPPTSVILKTQINPMN